MIRRFNFTERVRITQDRVTVRLLVGSDGAKTFEAALRIGDLGLPGDAHVFVEAYRGPSYMRFDFGTVGQLRPPDDRLLTEIERGAVVFFRVKVVDEPGRILAEADGVVPLDSSGAPLHRVAILPVEYRDLGELLWRLDFTEPTSVVLQVNAQVKRIREIVQTDKSFLSLVFPAVLREVLVRALIVEEGSADSDDDRWPTVWLRFAARFVKHAPPASSPSAREEPLDWIEEAVSAFAGHLRARSRFEESGQVSAEP